jgi:ferric-dicitrate binding protein FerR (iron transport regulator)
MMIRRSWKSEAMYEQAAGWLLRQEEGELRPAELRRYKNWLKSPDHRMAIRRMARFVARMDQLQNQLRSVAEQEPRPEIQGADESVGASL